MHGLHITPGAFQAFPQHDQFSGSSSGLHSSRGHYSDVKSTTLTLEKARAVCLALCEASTSRQAPSKLSRSMIVRPNLTSSPLTTRRTPLRRQIHDAHVREARVVCLALCEISTSRQAPSNLSCNRPEVPGLLLAHTPNENITLTSNPRRSR